MSRGIGGVPLSRLTPLGNGHCLIRSGKGAPCCADIERVCGVFIFFDSKVNGFCLNLSKVMLLNTGGLVISPG
jgi:hypothetical protein